MMSAIERNNKNFRRAFLSLRRIVPKLPCIGLLLAIFLAGCAAREDTVKVPPSAEQLQAIRAVVLALHDGTIIIPGEAMSASAAIQTKAEQRKFLSNFGPTIPIEIYDVGQPTYRAEISLDTRQYVQPGKAVARAPAFLFMKGGNDSSGKPVVRGQYSGYGQFTYSVFFERESKKAFLDGIVIIE